MPTSAAVILSAACARGSQVRAVDLIERLPSADKRPEGAEFHVEEHTFGAEARRSIATPPNSRLVWRMRVPAYATLNTEIGISGDGEATFRIGISDERVYEQLASRTVSARESTKGWILLAADLSHYGGWQWSLFHRPGSREWRINLSVTQEGGTVDRAFWATPRIDRMASQP